MRTIATVPWNLLSRLVSNPYRHLTSFSSRPGRRSSFPIDSQHPSHPSQRTPEGPRRFACSGLALSDDPDRRGCPSRSRARRHASVPDALTPVIVSIPRCAPRARALRAPLRTGAPDGHSYDSVSLPTPPRSRVNGRREPQLAAARASSDITSLGGCGELGHLASRRSVRAALTAHASDSVPRGVEHGRPRSSSTNVSNPRFIVFKDGNPSSRSTPLRVSPASR